MTEMFHQVKGSNVHFCQDSLNSMLHRETSHVLLFIRVGKNSHVSFLLELSVYLLFAEVMESTFCSSKTLGDSYCQIVFIPSIS